MLNSNSYLEHKSLKKKNKKKSKQRENAHQSIILPICLKMQILSTVFYYLTDKMQN